MKVKVFSGYSDPEFIINKWLESEEAQGIEIKFTNVSESIGKNKYGSDEHNQLVYIFYEEKHVML